MMAIGWTICTSSQFRMINRCLVVSSVYKLQPSPFYFLIHFLHSLPSLPSSQFLFMLHCTTCFLTLSWRLDSVNLSLNGSVDVVVVVVSLEGWLTHCTLSLTSKSRYNLSRKHLGDKRIFGKKAGVFSENQRLFANKFSKEFHPLVN